MFQQAKQMILQKLQHLEWEVIIKSLILFRKHTA